jgi:hypothetical protein
MLVYWNWFPLAWQTAALAWQTATPTVQAQASSTEGQTIYLILGAVLLVLIVIGGILWDWRRHK